MVSVRHVGIVVKNVEKCLKFYQELLELEVVADMLEHGDYIDNFSNLENVKVRTVKMKDHNGGMVELLCYHSHPPTLEPLSLPINVYGCSHVAFTVDDLEMEYNRLQKAGIKFNSPPQFSPDGKAKVTFCRDPEGCLIELVEELK